MSAPDDTPDRGEMEMAVHAAHGLFKTLNLIGSDQLNASDGELRNLRHELAIAGQMMMGDILRRL